MLPLCLNKLKTVLCLGAHSDDIEIGCGGTILKLARERPNLHFVWVVFSAEGRRADEARSSARTFLNGTAKPRIVIKNFRTSFFPFQGAKIKDFFERLKATVQPDLVLTHYREDRHQDHRVLSDLAWNTFRNHLILEYEIPKYDGDLGQPNVFVPLEQKVRDLKVQNILQHFGTQKNRHWFTRETFFALLRLRGMECASPTNYAEAFYCRKITLGFDPKPRP
jgi:LmbE family N-acetylglucosaminyl deacetylase